jgi:hypothetical protein
MKSELSPKFASELYRAFEKLGADIDLLSVIGSYADTLDDETIIEILTTYNDSGHSLKRERLVTDQDIEALANGTYKAPPLLVIVPKSESEQ